MNYNILLDNLPKKTPNGFYIRTDFREWIKFELLMQDKTIKIENKIKLALNLLFNLEKIKKIDIEKIINDILWFYRGGKETNINNREGKKDSAIEEKQIYSYEFDDIHIYTAFKEQYNINLNRIKYLHWWEFRAMFEDLKKETKIAEMMKYRALDISKIKDKEEKARCKKLKKIYALPDMRTKEEKEADFGRAFW